MKKENLKDISSKIENHSRYYFTTQWVFPNEKYTVEAFMRENFDFGFHMQSFYEIVFITRGRGYHFIGDETVEVNEGDLFIVPPGVRHAFKGKEGGMDVFHFHFCSRFTDRFMPVFKEYPSFFTLFEACLNKENAIESSGLKYKYMHFDSADFSMLYDAFYDLSVFKPNYNTVSIFECRAAVIISILCSKHLIENGRPKHIRTSEIAFYESVSFASENCRSEITVEQLAKMANMSRVAYIEKFKRATGTTPMKYVQEHRMRIAERLLTSSEKTVGSIAEELGFYDLSHFVKAFKRRLGMSPSEYRACGGSHQSLMAAPNKSE